jgi:hypothetical protein
LAPALAEPLSRLAFLHDLRGELPQADAAWRQAIDLEPSHTSAARAYRIGRAGVLAQLPGRAPEALALYEADPDHPRAAVELAMLRWGEPAALARALDAVSRPELAASLSGGSAPSPGWSFPLPGRSELLVFNRRNQQRCVLQAVRATTAHLRGAPPLPPSPLATPDCQGGQVDVRDLLCLRLPRPAANPRATLTARWLGCPAGSGSQPHPWASRNKPLKDAAGFRGSRPPAVGRSQSRVDPAWQCAARHAHGPTREARHRQDPLADCRPAASSSSAGIRWQTSVRTGQVVTKAPLWFWKKEAQAPWS